MGRIETRGVERVKVERLPNGDSVRRRIIPRGSAERQGRGLENDVRYEVLAKQNGNVHPKFPGRNDHLTGRHSYPQRTAI